MYIFHALKKMYFNKQQLQNPLLKENTTTMTLMGNTIFYNEKQGFQGKKAYYSVIQSTSKSVSGQDEFCSIKWWYYKERTSVT